MNPSVEATVITADLTTDLGPELTAYDWIFATRFLDQPLESVVPGLADRVTYYPRVTFPAFTPDIVYAKVGDQLLQSPLGDYNSALILYGWGRGLSAVEIRALFCPEVFERVGFGRFLDQSKAAMIAEGNAVDFPIAELLEKWLASGRFMHTVNHPKLGVLADIARTMLKKASIPLKSSRPEDYLPDSLEQSGVWPIYPGLSEAWEPVASYDFKVPHELADPARLVTVLSLDEYIAASLARYADTDPSSVVRPRSDGAAYEGLDEWARRAAAEGGSRREQLRAVHPYVGLPDRQFWRKAVAAISASEVDPVWRVPFVIDPSMKVATAGSCFAQHISAALRGSGMSYYVAEPPPAGLSVSEADRRQYGVFSARYGNVYTARQLTQLFDRAYGRLLPVYGAWERTDGRYVDAFRPQVEPDGFDDAKQVEEARTEHLAAVRRMLETLDVFVFTLGLTEAWLSKRDGAVFPLAPGVAGGAMNFDEYEFVNFSVRDVADDLMQFRAKLLSVNPQARIVLTVSPVTLIATYENEHVLVATTYSKAVLRVAADEVSRNRTDTMYFPAFEVVSGSFSRGAYFDDDLRSVRQEGVDHVMRLFLRHCTSGSELAREIRTVQEIVCDEEIIAPA